MSSRGQFIHMNQAKSMVYNDFLMKYEPGHCSVCMFTPVPWRVSESERVRSN